MALSATCLWASLQDVKPWLKLEPTDVRHDLVLEALCNAVTEEIERATDRIFLTRTITAETQTGPVSSRLRLQRYPVTSITSLTKNGTAVTSAEYWLDGTAGIVTLLNGVLWNTEVTSLWTVNPRPMEANVVCTYVAGYARASIPALVIQTGLELLRHRYLDWSAGADTVQSVSMGSASYVPRSTWPYQVKDAIERLRYEHRLEVA